MRFFCNLLLPHHLHKTSSIHLSLFYGTFRPRLRSQCRERRRDLEDPVLKGTQSYCYCPAPILIDAEKGIGFVTMVLQAVAGLQQQQGVFCEYSSLATIPLKLNRIGGCKSLSRKNWSSQARSLIARPVRCSGTSSEEGLPSADSAQVKPKLVLKIGSPVVVTQAPPLLKTAEPMPMMRPNNGLINVGDAGRIMDRKPKDTWAVRFAVGAYLIDRKYFEPLEM